MHNSVNCLFDDIFKGNEAEVHENVTRYDTSDMPDMSDTII